MWAVGGFVVVVISLPGLSLPVSAVVCSLYSVLCSGRDISGLLLHNSFHPGGKNTRLGALLCLVFTDFGSA